jgi:uncharacterized membrane protein YphA (DoxX/SURF4 family)
MTPHLQDAVAMIGLAVHIAVGVLLFSAGAMKLLHWQEFKGVVAAYRLLSAEWSAAVAAAIVSAELLLGMALVVGLQTSAASIGSAVLLMLFAAAMAINIRRGRTSIDCGCFQTTLRQTLDWRLVGRNIVIAAALVTTGMMPTKVDMLLWVQSLLPGLVLFAIYSTLNSLWALDESRRRIVGGS